jgi:hypothetical protein
MALSEVDRLTRPRLLPSGEPIPFSQPDQPENKLKKRAARWLKNIGGVGERLGIGLRDVTAPAFDQLKDHVLTIAAFGCADWAAWLWNPKTGLITASVLLLAFEMKVARS